ncbi:MAG: cytochrome P450, partial [Tumebacillaceae bacterium]
LTRGERASAFIINAPDFIREILATKDYSFRKGRSSAILGKTVGEGLLTTEGTVHEQQRRMMQPAFHKQRIMTYADTIVTLTDKLMQSWKNGTERLISEDMMDLTLHIIMQTMFGEDVSEEEAVRLAKAIDDSIVFSAKRLMSPFAIPAYLPTKGNRMHKNAMDVLNEAVYALIERKKHMPREGKHDLLSLLLETRDENGQPIPDREIRDQILTILIAGHETTANALSWVWYLLSQHPDVEAQFHHELDTVLGVRSPTFADVPNLTYTQLILQETLRLYPPAWMILREAREDVEIEGYTFPKNASMIICAYTVHRNPHYFPDPDAFKPERFASEEIKAIPKYVYFPFGGGSRACIGSNFAMMEATLILATIAQKYRLRLADKHHPIIPEPLVSLRIKDGLKMQLMLRDSPHRLE